MKCSFSMLDHGWDPLRGLSGDKKNPVCTRQGFPFFFSIQTQMKKLVAALWYKTKSLLCFVSSARSKYAPTQLILGIEQRQFISWCSYYLCLYKLWKWSLLKSCHINYPFLIITVVTIIVVNSLLVLAWTLKAAPWKASSVFKAMTS